MIRPTFHRWATSVLVLLGGGLVAGASFVGCTGDEFTTGGQGGGGGTGAGTPTTTSTGDTTSTSTGDTTTTSSGGECSAGCFDDGGECRQEQSVEHCGLGGEDCAACEPPDDECQEAFCSGEGDCDVRNRPELSECSIGACVNGSCKADAEVCLNDVDEDEDGDIGCGDSDCRNAGYDCSEGGENGFMGPVLVIAGPGDATCPDGLDEGPTYYTLPEADCGCSADEGDDGVPCAVDLTRASFPDCELSAAVTALAPGACTPLVTTLAQGLSPTTTCTAQPDVNAASVTTLTPCVLPDYGCNEGEACMPPVPAPSAGQNLLCLAAEGDVACPAGWNIIRTAFDQPEVDCTCDCTPDPECTGTVRTWTNDACNLCNEGDEACTEVPVPPSADCSAVAVAGTHVAFEVTDAGTPTVEGTPFLSGSQATFCCIPYPQTDP